MLCLTRKLNEALIVNDDITIRVVEIRGNRVKLGITAPSGHTVYREEIALKIADQDTEEAGA